MTPANASSSPNDRKLVIAEHRGLRSAFEECLRGEYSYGVTNDFAQLCKAEGAVEALEDALDVSGIGDDEVAQLILALVRRWDETRRHAAGLAATLRECQGVAPGEPLKINPNLIIREMDGQP